MPYVSLVERRRQQLIKPGKVPDPWVDRLREEEGTSSGANSDSEGVASLQGKSSAPNTPEMARREELEKQKKEEEEIPARIAEDSYESVVYTESKTSC